jgi:D-glutamate cyclase
MALAMRRDTIDPFGEFERLAATEIGRGITALAAEASGGLGRAAHSIARAQRPYVAVITGFFLPRATPPAAETDGPLGAAQIAAAVEALGGTAVLVTDEPCATVVMAAGTAFDVQAPLLAAPLPVDGFPRWLQQASSRLAGVTHVVSIERPGPSRSGVPRNMRGEDISASTAPLDRLFKALPGRHIAIGDGGNEIGMGLLPIELVERHVLLGAEIRCVVSCDDLVVAGTSNWGGHALVAAIAALHAGPRRLAEVLNINLCRKALDAMCKAGAADGKTLESTLSVDGLGWDDYKSVPVRLTELALSQ